MHARGVICVAKNIEDEITEAEAKGKQMVQDARTEGARIFAQAKSESEDMVKAAKQNFHRSFREAVVKLEAEAEVEAEKIVEKGRAEAEKYARAHESNIDDAAAWVAEEVIGRYGSNKV